MDQLDKFIYDIIDAKHLSGITDEAKQGLAEEMRDRLMDVINRALIDALPDDKVDEFSALLDNESVSDDQVHTFIAQSGIDTERVTAKAMLAFRDLYLQTAEERPQE